MVKRRVTPDASPPPAKRRRASRSRQAPIVIPETQDQLLHNTRIHIAKCMHTLPFVTSLLENARVLAEIAGTLLPGYPDLQMFCRTISTRLLGLTTGMDNITKALEISGGVKVDPDVREQLDEVEKRCREAVTKMKQTNGKVDTVLLTTDKGRLQVVRARMTEIEQRLEDGVLWRVARLRGDE